MNALLAVELLVRAQMEAEEEIEKSASLTGLIRGAGRVVQQGASATGGQLTKELGGGRLARLTGGAIKAAPTLGVVGLGAYGVESLAGHPVQRWASAKKQQIQQRLAQRSANSNAVYDPQTGSWY